MPVYAISLKSPNEEVQSLIREKYPGHYEFLPTFFLVRSDSIAESVAIDIGIKGDDRIEGASGVVFKLNRSYSGFTSPSLWDWLTPGEEEE